jgi:hypothetical protein
MLFQFFISPFIKFLIVCGRKWPVSNGNFFGVAQEGERELVGSSGQWCVKKSGKGVLGLEIFD